MQQSKREQALRISELDGKNAELLQLLEATQRQLLAKHKVWGGCVWVWVY
jgi:hypothetical protein